MDEHDGLCSRTDEAFGGGAIEVQAAVDVGENRYGARVRDRVGGGYEGERAGDDLIAGANPMSQQGKVQRSRSVARGHAMRGPHSGSEGLFESPGPFALSEHPGAHDLEYCCFLLPPELRPSDSNGSIRPPYGTAVYAEPYSTITACVPRALAW